MTTEKYDLIVLGAGSAARDGAAMASRRHGARVAIVERTRWGGSCPNVACRPTKAYLLAAELMHDIGRHAHERGIDASAPSLDLARTRRWKDSLIRDQESWVDLLQQAGYGVYEGEATLEDEHTVTVGDARLAADRILVATGGRTAVPDVPGIDAIDWIDHISALELEDVPESLLVVGGGPVGLEFAQMFARFGSRVTLVNHGPQIAARADGDAAMTLQMALEEEGIEIVLNSGVHSFARTGDRIEAGLQGRTVAVTHVLLASGRTPNVEALGLERVGVDMTRAGITVDPHQRTTVAGIWAAGDVAAGPALTPTAQYQARVAVADMFGDGSHSADYSTLPTAIFTDPELGGIGLTEAEAKQRGHAVEVVIHPLRFVTRAQYLGVRAGLYKIVFDARTRRVLGVHVVCRGASDIVGTLAIGLRLGATVDDLAAVHHVYPSFAEGLKAAAEQAA
ncbi:MAG TPA: NAD(P)/FAD-dependent oxidoreductase [Gaiellaceae bacterium]|nr:NAD(P)/FAD-dependent oxidoreductase [Gaiellaceae bacterium]